MWIIDRFEGEYAVIESEGTVFDIPVCALPEGVAVGDVISVSVDRCAARERSERADSLMNKIFGENR